MSSIPSSTRSATGIAYSDHGSGDVALLFLPGWCGPRTVFAPLVERLGDTCRTLTVDWRGHGDSIAATGEFGNEALVDDALSVIEASRAQTIIPASVAHAGWIGIELRRRLGARQVPKLAILDWMVLGAPAPFLDALRAMADPATTRTVVEKVSSMWSGGLTIPELLAYIDSMTTFPDEMWARGASAIAAAFETNPAPLDAIADLDAPPSTLHLYAQPADPAFLAAQQTFASENPWFHVERLDATSHFPAFEVPDVMAEHLRGFVAQ